MLCEIMGLNCVPMLKAIIIYSNIGGSITFVWDSANVILWSNSEVIEARVDVNIFSMNMSIVVLFVVFTTCLCLSFILFEKSAHYAMPSPRMCENCVAKYLFGRGQQTS